MAQTLNSPGVSVSVIDESFYQPATPGTIPLIFVATEQDKLNASKTGIAQGTTQANAGTVWVITSQRDLVDTFGTPYFETDGSGNPINGSEINEYGLQAVYSVLGVSSQAYVVRADVNLAELAPTTTPPIGTPANGTIWLDTSNSTYGINVWNTATNSGQGGFTTVTPLIIDDSTYSTEFSNGLPLSTYGTIGGFALVLPSSSANSVVESKLFYKSASSGWVEVAGGFDSGKSFQISPHYQYPNFDVNTATGSVWVCATPITNGATWDFKVYNTANGAWVSQNAPLYSSRQAAIAGLDSVGGGANITVGSIFVDYGTTAATFDPYVRTSSGASSITVTTSTTLTPNSVFTIKETLASGVFNTVQTINVTGSNVYPLGNQIALAINNDANLVNISATWNASTDTLTIAHALGGEFVLTDGSNTPLNAIGLVTGSSVEVSNWAPLTYSSQAIAPGIAPANGTLWFNSYLGDADIMYNNGTTWVGYRTAFPLTDPNGPIVSASAPTTQSDGQSDLQGGDIWIDSSTPDMFGQNISVWSDALSAWVLQDVEDHTSPNGWVFADARWDTDGTTDMDVFTPISTMLLSSFLDPDAPSPLLYPRGTRLYNTRRSSNNVKQYVSNYININDNNALQDNAPMYSYYPDRWVTASPNNSNGVGTFGRLSQRSVVVKNLQALVSSSTAVRDTDTLNYNLIATPGYTELIYDMVTLNTDIGQLALVIGDTPFRLTSNATELANYGNNAALAETDNDQGLITYDNYLAVYYPSGYTNDNLGNNIVVPPSHMMLNTIINNDNIAYPWFAPAGTNRGHVTNASSVGYVDPTTGEFTTVSLYNSLRDVLAGVQINPIATLPGNGLTVMGQYTRDAQSTALNRVNVSRLVSYIRRQLGQLSKPFLFEPNDSQTRNEIKAVIEGLMLELVAQRALYDYVVVCDSSNNTPTRIDQNELWVDIAIEPVKAVEFIYIPLRLLNTGAIASGNFGSQATGSK